LKKAYLTKQGATRINDEIVERKIGDILEKRLDDRKVQNEIIKNARNEILEAPFNPLKMDLEYEKKRKAIPPVMPTLNTNLNSGQGISLFSPFNNVDINKIKPIVPTYMDIAEINSREPVKYGSQMDDLTKSFGSLGLVQKSIVQPTYNFDPNQYKMDVDDDNRDNKRKKIGSSFGGKKTKRRKSKRRKYSKKRKLSRKRRHTKRRR
jgi:hypothetical protein